MKEDRSGCPLFVDVYLDEASQKSVSLSFWNSRKLVGEDYVGGQYDGILSRHYELEKGDLRLIACSENLTDCIDGGRFVIPAGQPMPELYACCRNVDSDSIHVRLERRFVNVTMAFAEQDHIEDRGDIVLRGTVCGFDFFTSETLEGDFATRLTPVDRELVFRIPVRAGNILRIDFDDGISIDLGKILSAVDYDWQLGLNEDIYIDSNVILGEYEIHIGDWMSNPGVSVVF